MSDVTAALAGLKAALLTIDPSPQPVPANVYVWPDDYAAMDYETFSLVIISQVVNRWFPYGDVAHGLTRHNWVAEVNICLAKGPLTRMEAAQEAETKQVPWLNALATVLAANRSLAGSSISIGTDGQLFRYRVGHIGWDKAQVFWGVRAEITVNQQQSTPTS